MDRNGFRIVGIRPVQPGPIQREKWYRGKPLVSFTVLALLLLGCMLCRLFAGDDPGYMDLYHCSHPPDGRFWFGTDSMGRDIFSMIWHGGRVSLTIGFLSAAVSALTAVLVGTAAGLGPRWLDAALMRLTEIILSVPGLLLVIFLQAVLGKASAMSLAFVIGITGWMSMAKVIRTEVRQLRSRESVLAARLMGAGFFRIVFRHLLPAFLPSVLFMAVMNIRSAIIAESTLSFMGIGLGVDSVSWGSMLAQAETSLLSGDWWVILIPGVFLVTALVSINEVGSFLRRSMSRAQSNL